jgi:hypothetical protein
MNSIFKDKSGGYGDLCARIDSTVRYEPVFRHHSRRSDVSIALRPLSLPLDDGMVAACALLEWTKGSPSSAEDRVEAEKKVLETIADSDAGQTFLGTIDDRAAFLTGIYRTPQHPVSGMYPAREGDYLFTLQMPPDPPQQMPDDLLAAPINDLSLSVLQACLTHYFSFPQVEKIIARIDKNDPAINKLYENAGFRFLREVERIYRLYYHTGSGYLDR